MVDGVVHCTPTGMATHPGCAVPMDVLTPEQWVSEIVYFPLETELLRSARQRLPQSQEWPVGLHPLPTPVGAATAAPRSPASASAATSAVASRSRVVRSLI